jgi:hypothetical protein
LSACDPDLLDHFDAFVPTSTVPRREKLLPAEHPPIAVLSGS